MLPDTPYSTFYLSQRPYLISGSLRDQILYPHPPAAVWEAASPAARRPFDQLPIAHLTEQECDERLEAVIEAVELDYLLGRYVLLPSGIHRAHLFACCGHVTISVQCSMAPSLWQHNCICAVKNRPSYAQTAYLLLHATTQAVSEADALQMLCPCRRWL